MIAEANPVALLDLEPQVSDFLEEALAGFQEKPRRLPCKFFYDTRGSELFRDICELPEYYVTRVEREILRLHRAEMAELAGPRCEIIGFGTGAGSKTQMLLQALTDPVAYVPVDISKAGLTKSAEALSRVFPGIEILPVCADYLQELRLPIPRRGVGRIVIFFPGSTIGNLAPDAAGEFLARMGSMCGPGGGMLIGVDLQKDRAVLERAYNDAQGVTAEFNLNILRRANRELDADFDLEQWKHRAIYNDLEGRIEMHLVSLIPQTVTIAGEAFSFAAHEEIVTEFSHKYSVEGFTDLAARAGFRTERVWMDDRRLFSVFYLVAQS